MVSETADRLRETRDAFDSVAIDYDGPRGNNASIQKMRMEMWRWLDTTFAPDSQLLDLGCGTGLDAVRMAEAGHHITATDWSAQMAARTAERAEQAGVSERVRVLPLGAHELQGLHDKQVFDGAYSNLGPLNCVPDLCETAQQLSRLLKPGGRLVFTVIGRICPWEMAHYARRGRWRRMGVRYARGTVAVGMNRHTIWTRYYTPREFYRAFEPHFILEHHRGLCLFAPPPYLDDWRQRHPRRHEQLWSLDRRVGGWPILRAMGDHFLLIMRKRS